VLFDAVSHAAKRLEHVLMRDSPRLRTISDNPWHFSYEYTIEEINIVSQFRRLDREMKV
jgi:hypothetical protein